MSGQASIFRYQQDGRWPFEVQVVSMEPPPEPPQGLALAFERQES